MTSSITARGSAAPTLASSASARSGHAPPTPALVTGVVLAGGMGRRMGGQDKGLVAFNGRPLVAWAIDALRPQVSGLMINANRNLADYAAFGYPVITDTLADFQGPLAGIACALAACPTPWLVTVPCDDPAPSADLVARLIAALVRDQADLAVAAGAGRVQPVYALLARDLAADLAAFLAAGDRKVEHWYERQRTAIADFSDQTAAFANLNTPADAARLDRGQP